jgi:serine protease AprX
MTKATTARLVRILVASILAIAINTGAIDGLRAAPNWAAKLDPLLSARASLAGRSRIVLRLPVATRVDAIAAHTALLGGRTLRRLPIIDGLVVDVPNQAIPALASNPLVERLSLDRVVGPTMEITSATVGADAVRQQLGYDGRGVNVAVIDSGVWSGHDDLGDSAGSARVDGFVDFVNGRAAAYDDYGHGTHVAGIVAGSGTDSGGSETGIAPGARLLVLKVLDGNGRGRISDVIAALDYVVANRATLHTRVINLSVAAGVFESYDTDPLTLAAKRAVSAGIVVVAAAGNRGNSIAGLPEYGGITAPGNAPWVITVGASNDNGSRERSDDTIARFSSRGPSAVDYGAKPDLVAPGVRTISLADPGSTMYGAPNASLVAGTAPTSYFPYMRLSGTSMSAPVVTGTVALMLQANPDLRPNAVKAILQYTAETYNGDDYLTQGAGFLNAKGAVELAAYLAAPATTAYPSSTGWSASLIWGNHLVRGGRLTADANAWATSVTWGDGLTASGDRVRWGTVCAALTCDLLGSKPWQSACLDMACRMMAGDSLLSPNVVWGSLCGGFDCPVPWTPGSVSATSDPEADMVVWGTSDSEGDIVVWGTSYQ